VPEGNRLNYLVFDGSGRVREETEDILEAIIVAKGLRPTGSVFDTEKLKTVWTEMIDYKRSIGLAD
jgi:hypothetical protein